MLKTFIKHRLLEVMIDVFFTQLDDNFSSVPKVDNLFDVELRSESGATFGFFDKDTQMLVTSWTEYQIDPIALEVINSEPDEDIRYDMLMQLLDETIADDLDGFQ